MHQDKPVSVIDARIEGGNLTTKKILDVLDKSSLPPETIVEFINLLSEVFILHAEPQKILSMLARYAEEKVGSSEFGLISSSFSQTAKSLYERKPQATIEAIIDLSSPARNIHGLLQFVIKGKNIILQPKQR